MHSSYVVISPMKNEAAYVEKTLESMIRQTMPPAEWIIVDDGSTDGSADIVRKYAEACPWIRLLPQSGLGVRKPEHYGGHVVDLFYAGLGRVDTPGYEFVVKLDCDVSFESTFFERLLMACSSNSKLGITSGVSYILQDGMLVVEKCAANHTLGATKMYRRTCLDQIGGLVRSMGWDGIDEIKARMLGWEAQPLHDVVFVHHRPEGAALGLLASGVERGNGSYFMGYHPAYMLARALRRMLNPSLAADGIGMLMGYFGSLLRGKPQIPDQRFIRHLRKHQIRKLLLLRSEI